MKKKKIGITLCAVITACAISACAFSKSTTTESETTLKDNQEYVYATVGSIVGNEMTYIKLSDNQIKMLEATSEKAKEKSSSKSSSDNSNASSSSKDDSSSNQSGEGQGGPPSVGSNDMPQGGPTSQTESANQSGDLSSSSSDTRSTSSNTNQSAPNMPSDEALNSTEDGVQARSNATGARNRQETKETVTVQIPVRVKVHTTADIITTFSRIEANDILKMLVEKDSGGNEVILEIWMQS